MKFTNLSNQPSTWEKTPDGFYRCKARILAERVMPYAASEIETLPEGFDGNTINMFVGGADMATPDALRSLETALITIDDHEWLDTNNVAESSKGHVIGTPTLEDGYLCCDIMVTHPDAIRKIESKEIGEISAAYTADTTYENNSYQGTPYQARQHNLCFNHIAIIPTGHGRAGHDVRILNKQKEEGEKVMADEKLVRVRLKNTGRYINVDEETASALTEENGKGEEMSQESAKSLEDTMGQLEDKNASLASLQSEIEELKGELSVYKEKLDQLLSEETVEHAAAGMLEDNDDAEEIVENALPESTEDEKKKKEEIMNSFKGLYGGKLHTAVLTALGVKVENMSSDAIRGAFKAQAQIAKSGKFGNKKVVAGQKMMNTMDADATANTRYTDRQRLGLESTKK